MNQQRRDLGDVGDVAYGLARTGGADSASLAGELIVVPAQMAYLHIPATELRNFVDGIFPGLAKNQIADSASGFWHRYRAGHDLLLDVPATFSSHGTYEGFRHAGHIILTDFPTKAGIPIPGFSHSGFGHLLEQAGISNGWLQLSFFDSGVGVLAIAEGSSTLAQAMQGALSMDFGTACQTFGMGSVEFGYGMATQNPLLLAGGLQDVFAGLVSTWKTISVYVDPLDFLGAAGTSALLGFGVSHGLVGESLSDATLDAARSGMIGALHSVSSAFGFGVLAGFVVCRLAGALAKQHNSSAQDRLTVDEHSYRLLVQELSVGNVQVQEILKRTEPKWIRSEQLPFAGLREVAPSSPAKVLSTCVTTLDCRPRVLSANSNDIKAGCLTLKNDPADLLSIYRSAFLGAA